MKVEKADEKEASHLDPKAEMDHGRSDEVSFDDDEEDAAGLGLSDAEGSLDAFELIGLVDDHPESHADERRDDQVARQLTEDGFHPLPDHLSAQRLKRFIA